MTNLPARLRRHLSYANLMASVAVFVALGGVGYAGHDDQRQQHRQAHVGAGKLKNGTLTSKQVKRTASRQRDRRVDADDRAGAPAPRPRRTTREQRRTPRPAPTRPRARTPPARQHGDQRRNRGPRATHAETATSADPRPPRPAPPRPPARTAPIRRGRRRHPRRPPAQQLQVACPAATALYGGMCWDDDSAPAADWIAASIDLRRRRRPPALAQRADRLHPPPGTQVPGESWSGDVSDVDTLNDEEIILTRDESTTSFKRAPAILGYRCLFYRVN